MVETPTVLPVALRLEGRRCLVVGGGRVATSKTRTLLSARATVQVVSPELDEELRALMESEERVTWRSGRYEERDLDGVHLVVAATRDSAVDQVVFEDAERRATWVNTVDDPQRSSLYFTALVRRGPVVVSVSTSGSSPALASYLKRSLEAFLDPALADLAGLLSEVRAEIHAQGRTTEGLAWEEIVEAGLAELLASGDAEHAREKVRSVVGGGSR
jgi:siroheme synthase-like protein